VPYDTLDSVIDIIEPADHGKRPRIWDRAFTAGAVKSYEPMLQARVGQLATNLSSRTGQSLDLANWLSFFGLDFMGDFAFGGAFSCMTHGSDYDGVHHLLSRFVSVVEVCGTIPWIRPLIQALPSSQDTCNGRPSG
jgi:hypothetical protein